MTRSPMVDLHRHLEGSVRTSTVLDIARREGHRLALAQRPRDLLVVTEPLDGLLSYLERVDAAAGVLTRETDWIRACQEVVLDAYDDGLDVLELRFSPWFVAGRTGLAPEAVIDAVAEGVRRARSLVPLRVGLIGILLRDLGPDSASRQLATIMSRRDHFCAIDIAGDEAGYPAEHFSSAYDRARDAGLRLTAHAGEAAGPESVWATVRHLRPDRIGHGVRSAEDPGLMEVLTDRGITLEVALTSNVQTRAAAGYARHPIRTLLRHGVPVTLNTDNPRASNVTLSQEHATASVLAGLTREEVGAVAAQAAISTFVRE